MTLASPTAKIRSCPAAAVSELSSTQPSRSATLSIAPSPASAAADHQIDGIATALGRPSAHPECVFGCVDLTPGRLAQRNTGGSRRGCQQVLSHLDQLS
jgi:hypothetical protein